MKTRRLPKILQRLDHPQKIQSAGVELAHSCTSAAVRAHSILNARISGHCSRSLSQPCGSRTGEQLAMGAQPLAASKSCCPISVPLQIGELTHAARPHNCHSFLIKRTHSARIKFSMSKACHFDIWGIETWPGGYTYHTTPSCTIRPKMSNLT